MDIENNYGNQVRGITTWSKTIVINRGPWGEQTIICDDDDDDEVVEPESEPKLWQIIVAGIVVVLFSPFILLVYLAMNPDKLLAVLVVVGIFLAIYYKNFI